MTSHNDTITIDLNGMSKPDLIRALSQAGWLAEELPGRLKLMPIPGILRNWAAEDELDDLRLIRDAAIAFMATERGSAEEKEAVDRLGHALIGWV